MKITKEMLMNSISQNEEFIDMVVKNKYCREGENNIRDVINRVIKETGITNPHQIELLESGRFVPAGSILSGDNSFSNCYLCKIANDSLESIFDANKELARTFSFRGGSGIDITVLRPANTPVNNAAKTSSGAVSFMPLFNTTAKTIGQNNRRAAMIITLDIRHPDVMKFIWCKAHPEFVFEIDTYTGQYPQIDCANISLKITDEFMHAVERDLDWNFKFPDISDPDYNSMWDGDYNKWESTGHKCITYPGPKAKEILRQISEASKICGDPGVLFLDIIQDYTMGTHIHDMLKPISCNPCGLVGLM